MMDAALRTGPDVGGLDSRPGPDGSRILPDPPSVARWRSFCCTRQLNRTGRPATTFRCSWTTMRPHREPGIRRDASGRIRDYVRANGQLRFKRFPVGTPLESVRRWRFDTRVSLESSKRPAGTLAGDIEVYLRQISDRPRLVADRRPATRMVGRAVRPPPSRRHRVGRRAGRACRSTANPRRFDVQPLPPGGFSPCTGRSMVVLP